MMSLADTLAVLADLSRHIPAEQITAGRAGVTIIVSNPITQARWHDAFGRLPAMPDVDVRVESLWQVAS
jgi:hypothetical protein